MEIAPELLKAKKMVIDLSADYRLDSANEYKKYYGVEHKDAESLKKSVYGLPELYREEIKKAKLIANPGCYPTAAILALAPVVSLFSKVVNSIIIDAKSGVSGAGRKATLAFNFCEVNENFKAYKVLNHQHLPEMNLYLSRIANGPLNMHFVPHLLPINRGILETIYVQLNGEVGIHEIRQAYERFYKTEPFVRVLPKNAQPELKNVSHTNFCDIAVEMKEEQNLLIITAAIDNLMKGAAGQAVQNMNLMCGFEETEALI
jgi:N-acetyl-gamma-glutamyl-phosphate reductase